MKVETYHEATIRCPSCDALMRAKVPCVQVEQKISPGAWSRFWKQFDKTFEELGKVFE